ncbi:hypothetical protein WJX81_002068 [Elliptochloris bilobata]|uniref:RRM domain-containing protein n=1 Tax=Elliptochloris bilobata TaxID=381761 RepID=A0AAW1SIV2_9CHLO
MPTEAELALQRKFELLRKKKEEKLRQQQAGAGAKAPPVGSAPSQGGAPVRAAAPAAHSRPAAAAPAPAAKEGTAHERALKALQAARSSAVPRAGVAGASQRRPGPDAAAGSQGRPAAEGAHANAMAAPPSTSAAETEAPKLSAVEAAKRALASQAHTAAAASAGAGRARPALKRPTVQRPAPPPRAAPAAEGPRRAQDAARPPEDGEAPATVKRARTEPDVAARPGPAAQQNNEATLFVGDLPPGFGAEDVEALFGGFAAVAGARVIGTQCYAFVEFESAEEAEGVLEQVGRNPLVVAGRSLRVSRAHSHMPDWKRGPPLAGPPRGRGEPQGFEHPKVREARAAARALASAPAERPGMDCGPPPERELVCYSDI